MLNALVCWVALEIGSALLLKLAPGTTATSAVGADVADPRARSPYYAAQDWADQYWHEFRLTRKERYRPFVLWRRAPFKGLTINIDEEGHRRTPGAVCSPDSFKVFVLGGSTVWGTGAPDWGTIPAYLQADLAGLHDTPVCVVNFGESAFVSTQSVITLLRQLQRGNVPQLVVSYDGLNDVYSAYQSGRADAHQNLDQVTRVFEAGNSGSRYSLRSAVESTSLFQVTQTLLRHLTPARDENASAPFSTYETLGRSRAALSAEIAQTYLTNYQVVDALSRSYGFKYVFFWPPYISIGTKPLTSEEKAIKASVDPALEKLYAAVFSRIEQAAPQYSNLHPLSQAFNDCETLLWLDDSHVTPLGNEMLARQMVEALSGGRPGSAGNRKRPTRELAVR